MYIRNSATLINSNNELDKITNIFKDGSQTYFYSSKFFPENIQKKVSVLYAFVRVADNYVDSVPQQTDNFYRFRREYEKALNHGNSNNLIINEFIKLKNEMGIEDSLVYSFLNAMESDIKKHIYYTLNEILHYIYGSAEFIGIMMAKILNLDKDS